MPYYVNLVAPPAWGGDTYVVSAVKVSLGVESEHEESESEHEESDDEQGNLLPFLSPRMSPGTATAPYSVCFLSLDNYDISPQDNRRHKAVKLSVADQQRQLNSILKRYQPTLAKPTRDESPRYQSTAANLPLLGVDMKQLILAVNTTLALLKSGWLIQRRSFVGPNKNSLKIYDAANIRSVIEQTIANTMQQRLRLLGLSIAIVLLCFMSVYYQFHGLLVCNNVILSFVLARLGANTPEQPMSWSQHLVWWFCSSVLIGLCVSVVPTWGVMCVLLSGYVGWSKRLMIREPAISDFKTQSVQMKPPDLFAHIKASDLELRQQRGPNGSDTKQRITKGRSNSL